MDDREHKPWWKTPVMWLVVGLPLASVVAGVSLVVIATRSGGADVVRDEVQRVSQIQTADLGPDTRARELGLSAVLRADEGVVQVIAATGDFDRGAPVRLVLQHPSRQDGDVEFDLSPDDTGWRGDGEVDHGHDWVVLLTATDGSWRLQGRMPREQRAVRLAPALGP